MFLRFASLASLLAVAALAAPPALAACGSGDRPPNPFGMKAAPKSDNKSGAIFFSWQWAFTRKVDRVCWDIEITDGAGKVVRTGAGVGPCASAHNRFTVPFTVDHLAPGTRRCMRVRARTEPGTQGCVSPGWTNVACATTGPDVKARRCDDYATRAVGTAKLARDTYKCNPATISGPRWSTSFAEHRNWCLHATSAQTIAEARARARIAQQCRVSAGMPQGRPGITVTAKGGDTFTIRGSGLLKNTPMIIVVSGTGAVAQRISSVRGQRIITDRKGNLTVTLFGAQVCKRGGGQIVFTAEDQDRKPSNPVTSKCAP
ncbi:MAG: hypothetical protein KIT16_17665 [Rhodospirillaceae bacterium]|nr:hypothetical protein [Rhodospirillaceae bacterium]